MDDFGDYYDDYSDGFADESDDGSKAPIGHEPFSLRIPDYDQSLLESWSKINMIDPSTAWRDYWNVLVLCIESLRHGDNLNLVSHAKPLLLLVRKAVPHAPDDRISSLQDIATCVRNLSQKLPHNQRQSIVSLIEATLSDLENSKSTRVSFLLAQVQRQQETIEQQDSIIASLRAQLRQCSTSLSRPMAASSDPNTHTLPSPQTLLFTCGTIGGDSKVEKRSDSGNEAKGQFKRTPGRVCSGCDSFVAKENFSKRKWRSKGVCRKCTNQFISSSLSPPLFSPQPLLPVDTSAPGQGSVIQDNGGVSLARSSRAQARVPLGGNYSESKEFFS